MGPPPLASVDSLEIIADVLIALRRVIRATDLYSRHLMKTAGLTVPQLLVLRAIRGRGEFGVGDLARDICLSQGTVTNILDRLESRHLVARTRSSEDKRRVLLRLQPAGEAILRDAPQPLQEHFVSEFARLPTWEQHLILAALQRVAHMMNADQIDAAPVLAVGDLDQRGPAAPTE